MTYKNPIGGYKSPGYKPSKNRARGKPFAPGGDPRRRTRQCGQGVVNGDERYCIGCGRTWPKNEDHP